jgi:hypothetical protein
MPQVAVQQPAGLGELMSAGGPLAWDVQNQQINDQTLGNLINRQQAQQDMAFQAQNQPYELEKLNLANQTTRAQLPGVQANSTLLQNRANVDTSNLELTRRQDAAKKLAGISDDEWAQNVNAIRQGMIDPSPDVRRVSSQLYQQLPDMEKLRTEGQIRGQNEQALEETRGKNQLALEAQQAAHGKYAKAFNVDLNTKLMLEGDPIKKDALIRGGIEKAKQDNDQDRVNELTAYLNANKPAYDDAQQRAAIASQGKPNISEVTGLPGVKVPTAQPPAGTPAPQEAPDKLNLSPQDRLAIDWARKNPNDPRAAQILQLHGLK